MRNLKAHTLLYGCQIAPKGGAFVEIGCIREEHEVPTDGYSTVYLARQAQEEGRPFYSVDLFHENVDKARKALVREGLEKAELVCCDGRAFLEQWDVETRGKIDLLYLDSHREPQYSYDQFFAAQDKLASGAVVAIDDAHEYDGFKFGKATDLIELFEREGFKFKVLPTEPGFKMVVARIP